MRVDRCLWQLQAAVSSGRSISSRYVRPCTLQDRSRPRPSRQPASGVSPSPPFTGVLSGFYDAQPHVTSRYQPVPTNNVSCSKRSTALSDRPHGGRLQHPVHPVKARFLLISGPRFPPDRRERASGARCVPRSSDNREWSAHCAPQLLRRRSARTPRPSRVRAAGSGISLGLC